MVVHNHSKEMKCHTTGRHGFNFNVSSFFLFQCVGLFWGSKWPQKLLYTICYFYCDRTDLQITPCIIQFKRYKTVKSTMICTIWCTPFFEEKNILKLIDFFKAGSLNWQSPNTLVSTGLKKTHFSICALTNMPHCRILIKRAILIGAIHKLRKQDFANFWSPFPLRKQLYYTNFCRSN